MSKRISALQETLATVARSNETLIKNNEEFMRQITELRETFAYLEPRLTGIAAEQTESAKATRRLLEIGLDIERLPVSKGALRDIQEISLRILQELEKICRKYKLQYWLDFGTLLGAVRHRGFIPWDDDMDVAMPVGDYQKLLNVIDKELAGTDFRFIHIPSQIGKIVHKDFMPHGEIETIGFINWTLEGKIAFALDIFPYYYANEELSTEQISKSITEACDTTLEIFTAKPMTLASFSQAERVIVSQMEGIASQEKTSRLFLGMETRVYQPRIVQAADVLPLKKVMFEDHAFSAPSHAEEYLVAIYGDYMRLPDHPHTHLFLESVSKEELKLLKKAKRKE